MIEENEVVEEVNSEANVSLNSGDNNINEGVFIDINKYYNSNPKFIIKDKFDNSTFNISENAIKFLKNEAENKFEVEKPVSINAKSTKNVNVNLNLNLNVNSYSITNNIFITKHNNSGSLKHVSNTGRLIPHSFSDLNAPLKFGVDLVENKEVKLKKIKLEELEINKKIPMNSEYENLASKDFLENVTSRLKQTIKSGGKKKSFCSQESENLVEGKEGLYLQKSVSNGLFKKLKIKYSVGLEDSAESNKIINPITPKKFNFQSTTGANYINNIEFNAYNYGKRNCNLNFIDILSSNTEMINRIQEIQSSDNLNPDKIIIKTIEKLAKIAGMIGVKYKREHFETSRYLPWECISISEADFTKYSTNADSRVNIIKLCQKGFLKIYPDIFRTDSSNHDPLICWALGVQISALNLQRTDDDWILLNKIFFKINGGKNCGYILKPETIRICTNDEILRKLYLKPLFKIKFKILSGFHLHHCFPPKTKINGIYIEATIRSPYNSFMNGSNYKPENSFHINETKLVTETINNNFLHPIWDCRSVQFEVYDLDLTFIILKVYSKKGKHLLARSIIPVSTMLLGFRVVDLYDSSCSKFDEAFLIVKCNKIII